MKTQFKEAHLIMTQQECEDLEQALFSMGMYTGAMGCSRADLKSLSQEDFNEQYKKIIRFREILQSLSNKMQELDAN